MPCSCKNCAAGLPDIYCVATVTLSPAEVARLDEITGRRVIDSTDQPKGTQ
jgi:hypothetical protein